MYKYINTFCSPEAVAYEIINNVLGETEDLVSSLIRLLDISKPRGFSCFVFVFIFNNRCI